MTDGQFIAFAVLLGAISLPSISLLYLLAWDLLQYGRG